MAAGPSEVRRHLTRALLRSLPLLPGPELYDLLQEVTRSRSDIEATATRASESLREAASLVAELEAALEERAGKVAQLREEAERYARLSEVEEEKARIVLAELEAVVGRNRGRERWVSLGINLVAGLIVFILGVVLGPVVTRTLGLGGP